MDVSTANDHYRSESWDKAFYAYGTAYIYEKRVNKYRLGLRILSFLGIAVPLSIGGLVISFNISQTLMKGILFVASTLGLGQIIASLWSIVARWEERYASALSSLKKNTKLKNKWERLAKSQEPITKEDFGTLIKVDEEQESTDLEDGITPTEKKMGMRAGLFKYKRPCATCNIIPNSMVSSKCDTCGNF